MTDFDQTLRHYCRNPKCRMKLKAPVENPYRAFCTRGCYRQFYRKRCLVCEADMERKTENQRICGKRRCRSTLRACPDIGRYPTATNVFSTTGNPHEMGTETSPQRRPTSPFANAPLNILGGGSWRWPNTPRLDADTLGKIRIREVGPLQINAPATVPESSEAVPVHLNRQAVG
jgi:hypothetical protein